MNGDNGEYHCPKCGLSAAEPGVCPVHGLPLLGGADYETVLRQLRRERVKAGIWLIALIFLMVLVEYFLTRR